MGDRLRLRTVAGDVAELLAAEWRLALGLAIAVFAPLAVIEALLGAPVITLDTEESVNAAALVSAAVSAVTATLGSHFYAGVLAGALLHRRALSTRVPVARTLRSVPYARLIALDLIITLAVAVGVLALVIPGLLAIVYLWLAPAVVEIEDAKVLAAVRRSVALVRGSFWRVAWMFLVLQTAQAALGGVARAAGSSVAGEHVGSLLATLVVAPVAAVAVISITLELQTLHARRLTV